MRARWHKWWLSALLVSACGLNPHPDLPQGTGSDNGSNAGGAPGARAGSSGIIVGGPSGGSFDSQEPETNAGGDTQSGAAGDQGGAGDSGTAEGGAGAEGGAAGADQLAPVPPK